MKQIPVIQPHSPAPSSSPAATPSEPVSLVPDAARYEALSPGILVALKTVFDPEIPVNIHDLGLIYDVVVDAAGVVGIRMTLTAPNCPAAQILPGQVEQAVRQVEGVTDVKVEVVFDPPWDRDRMSEAAKLQLGMW